jgi:hypothetical protein
MYGEKYKNKKKVEMRSTEMTAGIKRRRETIRHIATL